MKRIGLIILLLSVSIIYTACTREKDTGPFPDSDFISRGEWEGEYWPTDGWRYCSPAEVGMDVEKLKELNEEIKLLLELHIDIHSVLIVKNGYIVAEQHYSQDYSADSLHTIYSCTKSITSALIGIAIDEGYIAGVEEKMIDFFPDNVIENMDPYKESITLEHMLTMSAGLEWYELEYPYGDERNTFYNFMWSDNRVQFTLDRPMEYVPGQVYSYNTGLSQVLSAIVQNSTGIRADSFALERLFTPLGIEKYRWPIDYSNVANGGHSVRLTPGDMAKFGYLYLMDGLWDGEQLISADWVEVSQQKHIARKYIPDYYYGYHWWVSDENYYSAVGFGGQWIIIVPEYDLVVVFTNRFKEGEELQWETPERLLKTYIFPAMK